VGIDAKNRAALHVMAQNAMTAPKWPLRFGSVEPKMETVGILSKLARCIVPVSFVSNNRIHAARRLVRSCCSTDPIHAFFAQGTSDLLAGCCIARMPKRIHRTGRRAAISRATSVNRSGSQRYGRSVFRSPGKGNLNLARSPVRLGSLTEN